METYIEVNGEGRYVEAASCFIADVTLEVRAAKGETAMQEVSELRDEALAVLHKSGIRDDEIIEGGTDFRRPWYSKKQVGQNAARKIILKVAEFGRLNIALEQLEPLQSRNKERRTISVDMRQPEFEETADAKAAALVQAFEDAKQKAGRLAVAMNCSLGKVAHIEEAGWAKRNSGFSGDDDWNGDNSRFATSGGLIVMGAAGAAGEPEPELARPIRTIFVKCRVRFSIEHR